MAVDEITIAERYGQLENDRKPTLDRAEECANLTLPYAFPEENTKAQDNLNRGYTQGFGAQLVNHLVGKLALTILPPSQPFYRLSATQEAMEAVSDGDENAKFEIEKVLAQKEEGILRNINKSNFRASLYPALRLGVITGNCMIEKVEDGYKVINLKDYVLKRDFKGKIVVMIIKETLSFETLPEDFKSKIDEDDKDKDIDLYTQVELIDGSYIMTQELMGEAIGDETTIKDFAERFIDLGWNKIDGETYRRSFVEDHLGTLISLEKLTKAVFEGIAESLKIVKLVEPNGNTSYEDFVEAKHGDAIIGNERDVTTIQSQKSQDVMVAKQLMEEMKQELAKAFLVLAPRESERTPLGETQIVANQLEATLGGIYTAISGDIQRPVVMQAMKELNIEGGEDIDVIITTGVQALGRNVELGKINGLIQELQLLAQISGPEIVAKTINVGAITSAMVANSGVASKNFLYSAQEMEQAEIAGKKEAIEQQAISSGMDQAMEGGQQ